jgi:hypothetical protein
LRDARKRGIKLLPVLACLRKNSRSRRCAHFSAGNISS